MAFRGLQEFINYLESKGDLTRIKCEVNPELEIGEIADRMVKAGGKALLFVNTGTSFPLLINAFASDFRISAALGRSTIDNAGNEILSLLDSLGAKNGVWHKLRNVPRMISLLNITPRKNSGRGKCQEVVIDKPDLSVLPVLKCWPHDGGKFITLPLVHTVHPVTRKPNLGMYRMQIMDRDCTGMHWHRHKTGARHYQAWKEENQRMPVTVTLGGDPVYTYAATAPVPENTDEYLLAGFLRKKRVNLVRCLTNDLWIPEDSDIVIEGYVDPSEELTVEGPFGDHTGFYSLEDMYPVFHVTCITHRKNAVYPATIVGVPPMEDAWLSKATEKIFLAPLKLALASEIKDLHMPVTGVAHNLVLVSIDKTYPGQGMKVLNSLFGAGQMMFSKYIIVLDRAINLHDYKEVTRSVLENARFDRDILLTHGPLDVLDHSSDTFSFGNKMGVDATVKMEEESVNISASHAKTLNLPDEIIGNIITGIRIIYDFSIPVVIITVAISSQFLNRKELISLLPDKVVTQRVLVIVADNGADLNDLDMIVWLASGNSDPVRDISRLEGGGLLIDATSKSFSLHSFPRKWPNVVCSDATTIDLVDSRWNEYKIGEFISSPSLKLLSLVHKGNASASEAK